MFPLLTSIAFVLIGLLLLVKGSDYFIDGAAEIAKRNLLKAFHTRRNQF